jgi:hypothetical protein
LLGKETRRAEIAVPPLFAESTKYLRNKLDWALPVGRADLFDAPASGARVQSKATAHVNSFCRFFMAEVHQLTCLTRKYLS